MRLHYVGIRVSNLRRSLRFYTEVFGLKETIRGDLRGIGRGIWVGLQDPKSKAKLELNWYAPGSRYGVKFRSGEALDHIGFLLGRVSSRELVRTYERLVRAGARPTSITPDTTDGWMACVKDPDGNWLEIFRWPTPAEDRAERRSARRERRRKRVRVAGEVPPRRVQAE